MEKSQKMMGFPYNGTAAMDATRQVEEQATADTASSSAGKSPLTKSRSMSDGGGTPAKLSPSPLITETSRRTSKDDINLKDATTPVTPLRNDFASSRSLSLQMPRRDFTPPPGASNANAKPAPLSPKLDHSQIYASPTNILPRRSRGLDFSRAATSLHHSTLAEQSSPDSSPTIGGGRAMNIPHPMRRSEFGGPEQTSSSLWSMMGNQEKMHISGSLGSAHAIVSDSSSSSDDDDLMDEDMEEAYVTTPQVNKTSYLSQQVIGAPFGSPAMSSLASFQQRQRPRKQPKKKLRGPFGLGFGGNPAAISKSPPGNPASHARRESISWQANQLHISGTDADDSARLSDVEGPLGEGHRGVIRRVVTRRGNLLPKTKTFARIRAALLEEGAPAEAEFKREAEVVKQVRESDVDLEPRIPMAIPEPPAASTTLSSPSMNTNQESLDDIPEDDMMGDLANGLSSSFKQQVMKNSKGKNFWDNFSESSSIGGTRTTPPPPAFLPRGSSSGVSEDIAMDSPSLAGAPGFSVGAPSHSRAESSRSDTPQSFSNSNGPQPPTAAEITRRINSKRRRDDDYFDPMSFKRRAVSPGLSVHNSPVMQSPLQRDSIPWGSRPGSNGGDRGGSSAQSDSGSMSGTPANSASNNGRVNSKGRIGFQGMVDTNDGIMRMSIE